LKSFRRKSVICWLDAAGACCNTSPAAVAVSPVASCSSVGFRSAPLYDGTGVFQQLARCGVGRGPVTGAMAAGKPATGHHFAHDLLTLQRLYSPPQSTAEHFKPPFFPSECPTVAPVRMADSFRIQDTRSDCFCCVRQKGRFKSAFSFFSP